VSAFSTLRTLVKGLIPRSWRAPLVGFLGARRLLRMALANHEDIGVIEAELAALSPGWTAFRAGSRTVGRTERVVEIPWVISRYRGERRVLDIGPAFALPLYTQRLATLGIPELHGVDLAVRHIARMRLARADVRAMPYRDGYFDLVLCISAIEHVGLDNSRYGLEDQAGAAGDVAALREMRRVLAPAGRILITVPFGRRENQSWFRQYDLAAWRELVRGGGLTETELALYAHGGLGWQQVPDPRTFTGRAYAEGGLPGASAVLCGALTRG
jgi:O-antigen chain-terminating methyltransferase